MSLIKLKMCFFLLLNDLPAKHFKLLLIYKYNYDIFLVIYLVYDYGAAVVQG